jgi:hypothetical protein
MARAKLKDSKAAPNQYQAQPKQNEKTTPKPKKND